MDSVRMAELRMAADGPLMRAMYAAGFTGIQIKVDDLGDGAQVRLLLPMTGMQYEMCVIYGTYTRKEHSGWVTYSLWRVYMPPTFFPARPEDWGDCLLAEGAQIGSVLVAAMTEMVVTHMKETLE